jgi:thioredoxin 1
MSTYNVNLVNEEGLDITCCLSPNPIARLKPTNKKICIKSHNLFGEMNMVKAAFIQDETEFDSLLSSESLLVVDCTATWCGPCKLVAPLMDKLAEDYGDRIKVFKLDLDSNKSVAKRFGIRSIPAVMVFKQGEVMETLIGVKPYEEFKAAVERQL